MRREYFDMHVELSKHFNKTIPICHIITKRIFDIGFSIVALILCLPIFIIIGLFISLTSSGPIFYSSKRIGRGGRLIKCWKFRTMHINADKMLQLLLKNDPLIRKEYETFAKIQKDPRVTQWGSFLRKTSLDELPQFWNVLKGDLSVVGPRPPFAQEVINMYKDKAYKILSIRPGLTCLWQISGRSNLSWKERVKLDEEYANNYSFAKDISIILKTIIMLFSCNNGAY
jgi:exopolysaccharide production protein ExoY